jgi:hypothetical protein
MRSVEFLSELSNKPYPFKKTMFSTAMQTSYIFPVKNTTDNSYNPPDNEQQYLVGISSHSKISSDFNGPMVYFEEYPLQNYDDIFELTGKGNAIKVLSTVAAIVNDYIKEYNPERIWFNTAKSRRRKEFYDRITPKLSQWIKGYHLLQADSRDDYGKYVLVRNDLTNKDNEKMDEEDKPAPIRLAGFGDTPAKKFIRELRSGPHRINPLDPDMTIITSTKEGFSQAELRPAAGNPTRIHISFFQAYPQKAGIGTEGMKMLQRMAGEHGLSLELSVWEKGKVKPSVLKKFYKNMGFKSGPSGLLIWNPNSDNTKIDLDEYENQKTDTTIKKLADEAGYYRIGGGLDSEIYVNDKSPDVVKILIGGYGRKTSEAAMGFLKFIQFCKRNPNSIHLPKFSKVQTITVGKEKVYHVRMEKLYPLSEDEAQVAYNMTNLMNPKDTFDDLIHIIRGSVVPGMKPKILKMVKNRAAREEKIAIKNKSIIPIIRKIEKFIDRSNNVEIDFNEMSDNIMKRKDGTWVITDPYVG